MPFADLMTKIAAGEKLDVREADEMRLLSQKFDDIAAWVEQGRKTPYVDSIRIGAGGVAPDTTILDPFVVEKTYHATNTSIADATFTTVTFNQNKYGNRPSFVLDAGNQKIFIKSKARAFWCNIAHAWEASATGVRRVDFQYFDSANTLLGTALLTVMQGFAVEENWFTANRIADLPSTTSYIKARVKQTSGGALHLVYFAVDLHFL
jgi:hypothetical protein